MFLFLSHCSVISLYWEKKPCQNLPPLPPACLHCILHIKKPLCRSTALSFNSDCELNKDVCIDARHILVGEGCGIKLFHSFSFTTTYQDLFLFAMQASCKLYFPLPPPPLPLLKYIRIYSSSRVP